MCAVDWLLVLEYTKIAASWPPIALIIATVMVGRFRSAIDGFLHRLVEGNIFGQQFKAVPPTQETASQDVATDKIAEAVATAEAPSQAALAPPQVPDELRDDPNALAAIEYVREHPAETVAEYKRTIYALNHERVFVRAYGTQLSLLEFLAAREGQPNTHEVLQPFLAEHRKRGGDKATTLKAFVDFLVGWGLVTVTTLPEAGVPNAQITGAGKDFLRYIKAQYPLDWSNRAL